MVIFDFSSRSIINTISIYRSSIKYLQVAPTVVQLQYYYLWSSSSFTEIIITSGSIKWMQDLQMQELQERSKSGNRTSSNHNGSNSLLNNCICCFLSIFKHLASDLHRCIISWSGLHVMICKHSFMVTSVMQL